MKTINLQPVLDAIRNIEKNELIAALKTHGGRFDFEKRKPNEPFSIEYYDEYEGPCSATVLRAEHNPNTNKVILTLTDKYRNSYDISDEDVYPGHLSVIIDNLPEPDRTWIPS